MIIDTLATMTPRDRLFAAISILQAQFLARDSLLIPEKLWPGQHMPAPAIEVAIALLLPLGVHLEDASSDAPQ